MEGFPGYPGHLFHPRIFPGFPESYEPWHNLAFMNYSLMKVFDKTDAINSLVEIVIVLISILISFKQSPSNYSQR